jgi:lysophospholipase L1-like esterase
MRAKKPAIKAPSKAEFILLMASIAVAALMLELGARIWLNFLATPDQYEKHVLYTSLEPEEIAWTRHHYLNYGLTPNYSKGLRSHNSLGYRGPEFSVEKPPGAYRIVALGGSSTYTSEVEDDDKAFPAQLERILGDEYGYRSVEVINAGVGGYSSWETLINLEFRVLDLDPDLLIVYHGANDAHSRIVIPSAYRGDNSGRRKQWDDPPVPFHEHSCFLRILSRRMGVTRQVGLDPLVSAATYLGPGTLGSTEARYDPLELLPENPPIYFRRNLVNMVAIADAHDIDVLLSTWAHSPEFDDYASTPHYEQAFRESNDVVEEVAKSHEVPFFDFAQKMPQDSMYWTDGRHVNEAGALLKAELFAEYIHQSRLIQE